VHGVLFQQERRVQVDLSLTRGARNTTKRMLVNGQKPTSRADLASVLPLTVFTPEGVDIVRQGPEQRRHFITTLLTDVNPLLSELIERFTRIVTQRNALLRSFDGQMPSPSQRDQLSVWDEDFITVGSDVIKKRQDLLDELAPIVGECYAVLASSNQSIALTYESSWGSDPRTALQNALRNDVFRGYSTVGPHRDDMALLLNGRDARRQASQGEQRSLALSLRLAGHRLVKQTRGIDPLLLLDDVFSELDPVRSAALLTLLPVGQTLVTTASPLPLSMSPAAIIDLSKRVA
jgi:DNA replication and repair protein RecF